MRIPILIIVGFLGIVGQSVSSSGQVDDEQAVRNFLGQLSRRAYESPAESVVSRLGDAASVALTKIIAGEKPSTREIDDMLTLTQVAFEAPAIITNEADRKPRTTLFLLQYFESQTADPNLRENISKTRQYVIEQTKKLVRDH
jgi:hypothetical protein